MKTLIVVPTYNERENIEILLEQLLPVDPTIEVLVVDDNSPDGTAGIVEKIMQTNKRVHILKRPGKQGLGPAYRAGFKWGLERNYDALVEMDADLSHRPKYIPEFLKAIQSNDVVVGSRWMKGGGIDNWSWTRVFLSKYANIYSKLVLGVPIYDLTGGFICYRRKVLETINLDEVRSDGYCFQIEMKYRAIKKNFRITEIPIQFTDRKAGDSKISRRIVFEALFMVWFLKFNIHN